MSSVCFNNDWKIMLKRPKKEVVKRTMVRAASESTLQIQYHYATESKNEHFNRKQKGLETKLQQTAELMPKDLPAQVSEPTEPMIKAIKPPVYSKPRTTAKQVQYSIDVRTKALKERPNYLKELA